jgi:NADH:quinone reductase (non-electrogenic)
LTSNTQQRVVILGGGFGGVFTAKHLLRRAGNDVQIELINRNNFFIFQPLLPEVAGGSIHPSDAVSPLRLFLPGVAIRVAEVRKIDAPTKTVHVAVGRDRKITVIPYDHLVVALGDFVDLHRTPGLADRALVMKDVGNAFDIRNRVLGCLEDADETTDARRKQSLLTFVVIGGGFTGVETIGAVQELIRKSLRYYPRIRAEEIRIVIVQHGARILPELPEHLAAYATDDLHRRGVEILVKTGVRSVTTSAVETDTGLSLDAETIIAAIGNAPSPVLQSLPVTLQRGRLVVDRFFRVEGLDDVWALGDNAHIPLGDPTDASVSYAPPLAQFAFREAKVLAHNIEAHLKGRPLTAFTYKSLGTMASLGGHRGVADILGARITGFPAWFAWRLLYLSLLPGISTRIRVAVDWLLDLLINRSIVQVLASRSASHPVRFLANELVLEPGVEADGLYVVISGVFDVDTPTPVADTEITQPRSIGPGGSFGSCLEGTSRGIGPQERVTAREDSTAFFIDKSDHELASMVSALMETRLDSSAQTGAARA